MKAVFASKYYHGGDFGRAFEYWTNAAELGDAEAQYGLSLFYQRGEGVEKDEKKEIYYLRGGDHCRSSFSEAQSGML